VSFLHWLSVVHGPQVDVVVTPQIAPAGHSVLFWQLPCTQAPPAEQKYPVP
jgi:hypothetical protein